MPKPPRVNLSYYDRNTVGRNNEKRESMDFVQQLITWVKKRENEIKQRNPNTKEITHKIVITKMNF